MCRKHLLGEHVECHMFAATLNKKRNISGFIRNNLLEPLSLFKRHEALVKEMLSRGYKHISDLPKYNLDYLNNDIIHYKVCVQDSLKELKSRCNDCRNKGKL
jgi:hypothetical protein